MRTEPPPGTPIEELDTPALLVDLDAFEHNLRTMACFFAGRSARLRPHAKTHKCPTIALRQLAAGAVGITCAKLGEAEVMAAAGVRDILIANQVVGQPKIDRLTELARTCDVMVAVDDAANVRELGQACRRKGVSVRVLVEVNIGMNRCGVEPGEPTLRLARLVAEEPGLRFMGLQAYEGHLVLVPDAQERAIKVREALVPLQETCQLLERAGLAPQIVSGGGTGTYDVSGSTPPMTEIQAGSYVFMDATYLAVRPEFRPALTLLTTVISRPTPERIITDVGMKGITHDMGLPQPWEMPNVVLQRLSEEHARLEALDPAAVSLRPGDRLRLLPTHCCTTVNLHDRYYVVREGRLVDIWPIAARGRAQ